MATSKKQYLQWFAELKNNILHSQLRTALQVNRDMLLLYWHIGKQVNEKVIAQNWGKGIVLQLSEDLKKVFPEAKGYSERSIVNMQQFAAAYPDLLITQQAVAELKKNKKPITQHAAAELKKNKKLITQQAAAEIEKQVIESNITYLGTTKYTITHKDLISIPWGHIMLLLDKIIDEDERFWYIKKTIENNWSRAVLKYQIETNLYERQHKKKKSTNFHLTLPKPQSDLANQIIKDPYVFNFLQLGENVTELDLEKALIKHIQEFIVELGAGFAFVGRQLKLKAGRKEHFIDLLFYHLHLRCYVVIEIKMQDFEFAHTGQIIGYLNLVNKQLKKPIDNPSIGIILCSSKDSVEVDFALTNVNHPKGITEYSHSKLLPKNIKDKLPTAKQLQNEVKRFLKTRK